MKRNNIIPIVLFFTVFCVFSGAILLATGVTNTVNPATVNLTLFQTDLFADQNATGATIFTNATGTQVDIVNDPNAAFGQGSVPVGVYKRIRFTVQNAVAFSGPDPCDLSVTPPTVDKTFRIDPGQGDSAQVELYFATSDDGGSGSSFRANGTSDYPFLLQNPIEVKNGVTNVVKLIFDTANTLACDTGSAVLLRPDMKVVNTYIEAPLACTSSFPQEFWFSTFAIQNSLFNQQGVYSTPTMTAILQQTDVSTRWGMATFSKPDANGKGIVSIRFDKPYDDPTTPGIAMNVHNLANDGGMGYVYDVGALVSYTTMTSPYTLTGGGKVIIYTNDGTLEQGYLSADCSAYMGVDISSNKVQALNFGLKRPSGILSDFPMDEKFVIIGPAFGIEYNASTHLTNGFGFAPVDSIASFSTSTELGTISLRWSNPIPFSPNYAGASWTSRPEEQVSAQTGTVIQSQLPTVRSDGFVPAFATAANNYTFAAFGTNGSLITAAATTNISNPMFAGMWINADPTPSYSDLNGSWMVGGLHAQADPGTGGWNTGDETPMFGMLYGKVTIDGASRTSSSVLTFRDALSGVITAVTQTGTVELKTDCYAYDPATNQGLAVTTAAASCTINGIKGITLPVFYLTVVDQYGSTSKSRLVLDKTKKLVGVWDVQDSDGIPCEITGGGTCTPDPLPSTGTGIGIKMP